MLREKYIQQLLDSIKTHLTHPLFYPRIFASIVKLRKKQNTNSSDLLSNIVKEEYEGLSRRLDRSAIQDSCNVRNVLRTRGLAQLLVDDKGELNLSVLPDLITQFSQHLYSLGPLRQHDAKRQEHILKVLKLLRDRKDLVFMIKKLTRPFSNKLGEELIRQSLCLSTKIPLTDAHARQAVLAAWFCYLRQNVGSCFATAPAEIIHDEQPDLFLQDVLDLLSTGSLKRTYGGVENSVPLSPSWGNGDLRKPLFIRVETKKITPEVWYSPSLMLAFEAVGIINSKDNLKIKVKQIEQWVMLLIKKRKHHSYCILTAEEIIKNTLMNTLELTEVQLKQYENRPDETMYSQLIIHTPQIVKKSDGINERCENFYYLFEQAKNVFKAQSDNALLKAWEFTIASFSDIKYEFGRWNFYASLGLQTDEPGGIGQCIFQIIQKKLDDANSKVQEIQYEYEMVYTQVKTMEARMRHTSTEQELQWLKIEYQTHTNEFYFLQEQRDAAQHKASSLVNLYDTLYDLYVKLFEDYFQEVYDADMQEVSTSPFDDSPAGFRLLYKHGRSNTSQWTRIKNKNEFIESLTSFFVATEHQIAHALMEKKIEKDLADVVTAIINHIKTDEFIETAFNRMAIAHKAPVIKNPLQNLDKIEKRPWVYTSGGTMNTLVSCYYRIEDKPKEVEKWVENEMELLVFIADALKGTPFSYLDPFVNKLRQSILMHSPTHAFLFKPTLLPFRETWTNEQFTYTFIRDRFIRPAEIFVERLLLNNDMISYLTQQIYKKIPENYQPRFKTLSDNISGPLNPIFFREQLTNMLENDKGLLENYRPLISNEEIDGFLYESLPLCPIGKIRDSIEMILNGIESFSSEKIDEILKIFDKIPFQSVNSNYINSQHLQNICKALVCLYEINTSSSFDYHLHIILSAQKLGFAMPTPLIFADTNWVKDFFGFVVSPGTGRLELWRLDYTGSNGFPMHSWKQWVNGTRSDRRWGIYTHPFQYGQN